MKKYVICSIGLTAAGKTTLLKKVAHMCNIFFISEATIKRNMVQGEYNISNSMDEELRSQGYKAAIELAFDYLSIAGNNVVIIDASFHQLFRRLWIYDEIIKRKITDVSVVWLYCKCDNESIIKRRINQRYIDPIKTADNQANTYDVYKYTLKTFDEVDIRDFKYKIPTYLVEFHTDSWRKLVVKTCCANETFLDLDILNWRKLWESYM